MRAGGLCAVAILLATWPVAAADPPAALSVEISLAALPEKSEVYEAVAIVSETDGGGFLAAPFLRLTHGETTVTTAEAASGGTISLSIGPVIGGTHASWLVVWRRDGEIAARATGVVRILP